MAIINVPSGPYKDIGHVSEVVKVDITGSTKSITLRESNYPKPGIYERTITSSSLEEKIGRAHV